VWLLILAIVILFMSALQSAYYVEALTKKSYERPPLLMGKSEMVFIYTHIVSSLAGITLLFIAAGWKWGLGGLAIYWVFVLFVLMPIGMQRLLLLFFRLRK